MRIPVGGKPLDRNATRSRPQLAISIDASSASSANDFGELHVRMKLVKEVYIFGGQLVVSTACDDQFMVRFYPSADRGQSDRIGRLETLRPRQLVLPAQFVERGEDLFLDDLPA